MKKRVISICILVVMILALAGCKGDSSESYAGIWYADRTGTEEILLLNEDGTFCMDGQSGIYAADDTYLILASKDSLFGIQKFRLDRDEEDNPMFTYTLNPDTENAEEVHLYTDSSLAEEKKAVKDEEKQEEDTVKLDQIIAETQSHLLGIWEHREKKTVFTLEFKEEGVLIATSTAGKVKESVQMVYEIKDGKTLVIEEMGKKEDTPFSIITKDGKTYLTINNTGTSTTTYTKS